MRHIAVLSYLFGLLLLAGACQERMEESTTAQAAVSEAVTGNDWVEVTQAQFAAAEMQLGEVSYVAFPEVVKTNGYIDVPPSGKAGVSVYYGGYVQGIDLLPGQWVKKGQILFSLENPEFVQMQQDYLETTAQLTFLRSDFERQQTLAAENISSQKSFLKAESDYQMQLARSEGLRKKLQLLGIDPDKIDGRQLQSVVKVYAPLSGFITRVNTSMGSFLNASQTAVEITNTEHLHLELEVFEKDVHRLQKGQLIEFWQPGMANKQFRAQIHLIGSIVEGENRIVRIHGHLEDEKAAHGLLPGMYVEARIETTQDSASAVPEEAIVTVEDQAFVLVQQEKDGERYLFEKQQVETGRTSHNMVEIKGPVTWKGPLLVKGAFNLIAEE